MKTTQPTKRTFTEGACEGGASVAPTVARGGSVRSIGRLSRVLVMLAAVQVVSTACSSDVLNDCEAWQLALDAREATEAAVAVLGYEVEQWEAWMSAASTANALIEDAWELAPDAESTASAAWDTALAALEAVDSTAPASLAAAESISIRYPSTSALEVVQEAARASAAAFTGVAVGCPRGPPRAALSTLMTESGSGRAGCEVWAWAVAAEAEATAAYEAMWRARELAALADSVPLTVDAEDTVVLAAREAAGDLAVSTLVAAIEAGVAARKARDLVTHLAASGCGGA